LTQAYVYKWTHIPTLKWYVGSRTKKDCHPDDGYICSSKIIKPLIQANPAEWRKEIIAIGDPLLMRKLEAAILETTNAKFEQRSFNLHNGDGKFTTLGTNNLKGVPKPAGFGEKISRANTGRPMPEKAKKILKQYEFKPGGVSLFKGKTHSEETKQQMSKDRKGLPGRPNFSGHRHTEESKQKASISCRGINAKLTNEEVFDIKYNLGYSEAKLKYGHKISASTIEHIRGNKTWKHI